jgi:hypothetical protein
VTTEHRLHGLRRYAESLHAPAPEPRRTCGWGDLAMYAFALVLLLIPVALLVAVVSAVRSAASALARGDAGALALALIVIASVTQMALNAMRTPR